MTKIIHKPELSADVELRVPNISKARELLGFEPKVSLEEGIRLTANYYKENNSNLPTLSSIFGE